MNNNACLCVRQSSGLSRIDLQTVGLRCIPSGDGGGLGSLRTVTNAPTSIGCEHLNSTFSVRVSDLQISINSKHLVVCSWSMVKTPPERLLTQFPVPGDVRHGSEVVHFGVRHVPGAQNLRNAQSLRCLDRCNGEGFFFRFGIKFHWSRAKSAVFWQRGNLFLHHEGASHRTG